MTIATAKPKAEVRSIKVVELRSAKDGEKTKISGYAAVFNSPSEDLGGFIEVIKPGAFSRALREKQDVVCVFNHDTDALMGRTRSGTLTLKEDTKGLFFECTLPDTQAARDMASLIDRGDVYGCSFRFRPNYANPDCQRWLFTDQQDVRELLDVDLFDVGPVTEPAYEATDVALRSRDEARAKNAPAPKSAPNRKRWVELSEAEMA